MKSTVTAFQQRVYDALRRVPKGFVVTYAELGRAIGCGSPRAIGQALKVNPFWPEVPCHRVIAAGGRVGGFQGQARGKAVARKLRLLNSEGVQFECDQLVDVKRLYSFKRR